MPEGYRLRAAEERDLEELNGIERRATRLYRGRLAPAVLELVRTPDELRAGLASRWLWVAVDERDRPLGFALGRELACGAHLEELDIDPEHGRRGLGRALVEHVCRVARRRGHLQVTLTTYADVPWNAPWYERLGFRVLARGELSPPLERVIENEARLGLDWKRRVVMRRRVARGAALLPWLVAVWLGAHFGLSAVASRQPWVLDPWLGAHDKLGHFVMTGGLAFFAVAALSGRCIGERRITSGRVLAWVVAGALIEELLQNWQPMRTLSLWDLAAGLAGIATLGGLAAAWKAWQRRR